ncbi:helix-turn-helix domain-containing protein [Companilactobacillus heilongjiangensis]|uniref:Transcriptional regulator n=1 Tax=Companilactobacillus heilongjiangensis TaxID=1074467 RepID=A0A0K2LFH0_9LACO|nr:helix-turn-helix transcriptional regulator [Companilactobacillus heilongjiangensis]ALB30037.1 transcriptional regulator [Companilactobacillus heilongjiangensis]
MTTIKFDDFLNKKLENPEFKKGYDSENSKLQSAIALYKAREKAGLTQRELSSIAKVPQSTIARIERGDNTSVDTLDKLARALGKTFKISIS